jgi:cell division protein FtsB
VERDRPKRSRSTARRRRVVGGRALVVAVVVLVALLYYRPLTSYLETRSDVQSRSAEVAQLTAERAALERRLAISTSTAALRREARRIGYVRPGERLFIVKGIDAWKRAQAERRER